jgi:Pectate lyase superfamily protein
MNSRLSRVLPALSIAAAVVVVPNGVRAEPVSTERVVSEPAGGHARTEATGALSLLAFGARCDGAGDDTPAFEAAAAAAREAGGGRIEVPTGACQVSRPVELPTNTIVAGTGRRSRVDAAASMSAMFVFRIAGSAGFAGGLRDLHLDGRDLADYAVSIDSWRNAAFLNVEANNLRVAFVRATADQNGDSAGHVFENVWVRDDPSTTAVGSRFAVLSAGRAGKVTDTAFTNCAATAVERFRGSPAYVWELRDTARVYLNGCRVSSSAPFDASVAILQSREAPAGALVQDHSSGANVVRDLYHEQHGGSDAVGVLIEGARAKRGEYQRNNVVENVNMQPATATAARLVNSGAAGNTIGNRILLPQRTVTGPKAVDIGAGVAQTTVVLIGGNDTISVGPGDTNTVRDLGAATTVNGQVAWHASTVNAPPDPAQLGANLGDVIRDDRDGRTYVLAAGGAVQIGTDVARQRLYAWIDGSAPTFSLGVLPAGAWVLAPARVQVIEGFSQGERSLLTLGTSREPRRYGIATLDTPGVVELSGGTGEGYSAEGGEVLATVSGSMKAAGRALTLLEFYRIDVDGERSPASSRSGPSSKH